MAEQSDSLHVRFQVTSNFRKCCIRYYVRPRTIWDYKLKIKFFNLNEVLKREKIFI